MTDPYDPVPTGPRSRRSELIRAGWGAALLLAPRAVLAGVLRVPADQRATVVARILGARHVTRASLSGPRATSDVLAMGVWVDTVHAATAAVLAGIDRDRARAAIADSLIATAWAAAGYRDLAVADAASRGSRQRRRDQLSRAVLRVAPGGRPLLDRAGNHTTATHSTADSATASTNRTHFGRTPA